MALLTIGNDSDNEAVGNPLEVYVIISGLTTTLAFYRFDVTFSPAVLSAVTADAGTIDNTAGTINGIARSNVGMNAGGTLLTINFQAIAAGPCFLSIPKSSVTLTDADGKQIPCSVKDGKVFVAAPQPT